MRTIRTAAVLLATLAVASCGQRIDHAEIVAAAGGGPATDDGFGAGDADGSAGATTPTTGTAAGTTATSIGSTGAPVPVDSSGAPITPGDTGAADGSAGGAPAASGPACPNGPLSPVNIGHLGGYEGLVGATIAGGLETAQVWARSVNSRGGLNCHPVNLIALNDRNDPNTNASLVRRLVEQEGVIAFVGNLTPLSLGGGLSYLEQRGVPLVGGDLVHPGWFTSPTAFGQGTSTIVGAPGSIREGVQSAQARGLPNPTRAALFVCEVEACVAARGPAQSSAQQFGYELVYTPNITLAQTNFTSQCREAQSQNVGVIMIGGSGATLESAANSCADQGYHPQWVTYSLAIQNSLTGNPNLEAVVGASPTFPWMSTDGAAAEFQSAVQQFAPGLVTSGAASQVWTSGKLLEAAARSLPESPTSADIIAGLTGLQGDTLGGLAPPLSYTAGAANPQNNCYFVVQVISGAWTAPKGNQCIPVP